MIQCPQCHEQSATCIGGSSAGRFTYMCSNSDCVFRWSQYRVAPGENADVRPARRAGGYCCRECHLPKRDPHRNGSSFGHICHAYTLGFNKVLTRMIGGNPGIQQTACRAVYLSKRLAALQRVFRAHLYAVRIMPRRKRLITALGVVRNVDSDSRRMIMEMAGLANFRTTPPQPYAFWNHRLSSMSVLDYAFWNALDDSSPIIVVEGHQPGDNIDDIVQEVLNLLQAQSGASAA